MPNVNDTEEVFGRKYRYIKPGNSEPGTWRLSMPETGTSSPGGGAGGGIIYDFDGVNPIQVDTSPGTGPNPTRVVTSFDIQSLNSRV